MLDKLIKNLSEIDKITYNLIKKGLKFSFFVAIISSVLLLSYLFFSQNLNIYYAGLSILKSSSLFAVFFIICGISMDTIRKQTL